MSCRASTAQHKAKALRWLSDGSVLDGAIYHAIKYHRLLASSETMEELVEVTQRNKLDWFRKHEERLTVLAYYQSLVVTVPVTKAVIDCRDEKDNKFLSVAVSGQADILVSSDEDLLMLNPYRDIPVLTARQYAEQFGLLT